MIQTESALLYTLVLGCVIFFCRVFPFIIFRNDEEKGAPPGTPPPDASPGKIKAFVGFVEKVAPPVAMTVLAFNALASPVKEALTVSGASEIIPLGAAAAFTAAVHLWKRNTLISIFGGTALYMLLERLLA
jgi:branched-subunit amino acid transport protein AzlD